MTPDLDCFLCLRWTVKLILRRNTPKPLQQIQSDSGLSVTGMPSQYTNIFFCALKQFIEFVYDRKRNIEAPKKFTEGLGFSKSVPVTRCGIVYGIQVIDEMVGSIRFTCLKSLV